MIGLMYPKELISIKQIHQKSVIFVIIGFKYFVIYSDNDVIRPLFIILPQMIWYVKWFDSNKTMSSILKYGKKIVA